MCFGPLTTGFGPLTTGLDPLTTLFVPVAVPFKSYPPSWNFRFTNNRLYSLKQSSKYMHATAEYWDPYSTYKNFFVSGTFKCSRGGGVSYAGGVLAMEKDRTLPKNLKFSWECSTFQNDDMIKWIAFVQNKHWAFSEHTVKEYASFQLTSFQNKHAVLSIKVLCAMPASIEFEIPPDSANITTFTNIFVLVKSLKTQRQFNFGS